MRAVRTLPYNVLSSTLTRLPLALALHPPTSPFADATP